jgi:ankyrin repeat protein
MKIHPLRGAVGDERLLEEHKKAIELLLKGDYRSKDLEQLQGCKIFSFKLSDRARLLFAVEMIKNERCMVVLDFLPNHEYDGNRFLKSGVFARYMTGMKDAHEAAVEAAAHRAFVEVAADERLFEDEVYESAGFVDYHERQWIKLDNTQEAILKARLPAVCSGSAGSGKSSVALSLLRERELSSEIEGDILYVTQSEVLVREMQASFAELPELGTPSRVLFRTFDALLQEIEGVDRARLVDQQDFTEWYGTYASQQKKRQKASGVLVNIFDVDKAYQECCVASGYSRQGYCDLGKEQSHLEKGEQRRSLYDVYEAYMRFLKESGKVSPAFHQWTRRSHFPLIVVDEAQDLSNQQLLALNALAIEQSVVYFMDSHQQLGASKSKRPFLLQHCGVEATSHILLNKMYRCPLNVVAVANGVIGLKVRCVGGLADRQEFSHVEIAQETESTGYVALFDDASEIRNHPWLQVQLGLPHCCIITEEACLEEARALFPECLLIMTPRQVKGLEYAVVITYKLYNHDFLKQVREKINELGDEPQPVHRPKGEAASDFVQGFNAIYTSYTRTKSVLVVCEPGVDKSHPLMVNIVAKLAQSPLDKDCLTQQIPADWHAEAMKQLDAKNEALARLIFRNKLGLDADAVDALIEEKAPKTQPKKLALTFDEKTVADSQAPLPVAANVEVQAKPVPRAHKKQPKAASSDAKAPPVLLQKKESKSELKPSAQETLSQAAVWVNNLLSNYNEARLKVVLGLLCKQQNISKKDIAPLKNFLQNNPQAKRDFCAITVNDSQLVPFIKKYFLKISPQLDLVLNGIADTAKDGFMPIHWAAAAGHVGAVDALLALGVDVNQSTKDGHTPACVAALYGHIGVLKLLAEKGADLNKSTEKGYTPAHIAADCNHDKVLRVLAKFSANLNVAAKDGFMPIHLAAAKGHVGAVEALLTLGVDVNQEMHDSYTPAYVASRHGHIDVLKSLHDKGANLNKSTKKGYTPAYVAAHQDNGKVLLALSGLGADVGLAAKDSVMPIHVAASKGHLKAVVALLALGVDVNQPTKDGQTPAFIAALGGHKDVLELLAKNGANLTQAESTGMAPIHAASRCGRVDALEFLLDAGVDANQATIDGSTPLAVAAEYGIVSTMQKLNQHGVDINKPKNDGSTPVFLAAQNNRKSALILLIGFGADLEIAIKTTKKKFIDFAKAKSDEVLKRMASYLMLHGVTEDDMEFSITPLSIAKIMGHEEIEALLQDALNKKRGVHSASFFKKSPEVSSEVAPAADAGSAARKFPA